MNSAAPYQPARQVIHEGAASERRLHDLGLSVDVLQGAVLDGDEGRQACTPFHPRQAGGQRMWSDTTAGLRARCLRLDAGWSIDRTNNFETTANSGRGIAIAVMGGDEFTGYRGSREPRVKRKRGPVTRERVKVNFRGMEPLFRMDVGGPPSSEPEAWHTWLLLVRATEDWQYLELSEPIGLNDSGQVDEWSERILIPRLAISGGVTPIADDEDEDDIPFMVVEK